MAVYLGWGYNAEWGLPRASPDGKRWWPRWICTSWSPGYPWRTGRRWGVRSRQWNQVPLKWKYLNSWGTIISKKISKEFLSSGFCSNVTLSGRSFLYSQLKIKTVLTLLSLLHFLCTLCHHTCLLHYLPPPPTRRGMIGRKVIRHFVHCWWIGLLNKVLDDHFGLSGHQRAGSKSSLAHNGFLRLLQPCCDPEATIWVWGEKAKCWRGPWGSLKIDLVLRSPLRDWTSATAFSLTSCYVWSRERQTLNLGVDLVLSLDVLLNMNNFTENQHRTRPLCDLMGPGNIKTIAVIISVGMWRGECQGGGNFPLLSMIFWKI